MSDRFDVFVYGCLRDFDVREIVIGPGGETSDAVLTGYRSCSVAGRFFPGLEQRKGAQVSGVILHFLTGDQMAAVDFYLDSVLFSRRKLAVDGGQVEVHVPISEMQSSGLWDYKAWQLGQKPAALRAAIQIMRSFPVAGQLNTPIHHHGVNMRAQSNLRAAQGSAPANLRRGFGLSDVYPIERHQSYAGYFAVEDMKIRHKRFDSGQSEVLERAVFLAADAVTVLPYDPAADLVLMVEQFRPAAYARDDANPWVLEPVAGRCDADEPVEEVAKRELREEAGLSLRHLEKIGSYYSSPGCMTEYLYSFVGIVDLADVQAGRHGLASEGEDIQTHILSFQAAMELMATGEADNGPLFVSLLWLQANRARLRQEWGSA